MRTILTLMFLFLLVFQLRAQATDPSATVILIADATFTMGSIADVYASADESPSREVTVTLFAILDREITEWFYDSVMSGTPSTIPAMCLLLCSRLTLACERCVEVAT